MTNFNVKPQELIRVLSNAVEMSKPFAQLDPVPVIRLSFDGRLNVAARNSYCGMVDSLEPEVVGESSPFKFLANREDFEFRDTVDDEDGNELVLEEYVVEGISSLLPKLRALGTAQSTTVSLEYEDDVLLVRHGDNVLFEERNTEADDSIFDELVECIEDDHSDLGPQRYVGMTIDLLKRLAKIKSKSQVVDMDTCGVYGAIRFKIGQTFIGVIQATDRERYEGDANDLWK